MMMIASYVLLYTMHVKNGDKRTNGKVNSRSRMGEDDDDAEDDENIKHLSHRCLMFNKHCLCKHLGTTQWVVLGLGWV